MKKVAVLLSGGVDSAVCALILKKQFDVIGITGIMSSDNEEEVIKKSSNIAKKLNISHHIINIQDIFKEKIISYYAKSYIDGITPCPCVMCNKFIKFGVLLKEAMKLGASSVATGHYAKILENEDKNFSLFKADDEKKDQSYFLSLLPKDVLSHTIFPLSSYSKDEIKKIAVENSLISNNEIESQDLCFVTKETHPDIIKEFCDIDKLKGKIKDENGKILGTHTGIYNYTTGKRKGLNISFSEPLYVKNINPENKDIIVATKESLYSKIVNINDFNFLSSEVVEGAKVICKVRYNHKGEMAIIKKIKQNTLSLEFLSPVFSITKGQVACLYNENKMVLGGGIIF